MTQDMREKISAAMQDMERWQNVRRHAIAMLRLAESTLGKESSLKPEIGASHANTRREG